MKLKVKIEQQSFEVEVGDLQARPVIAVVDGERFEVWPEEEQVAGISPAPSAPTAPAPAPTPVAAPAAPKPVVAAGGKSVAAPIPGTILAITVKPGDKVNPGQELITLEAMKMKSAIRASRPATIAQILVKVGDRVSQGQALVEFTD